MVRWVSTREVALYFGFKSAYYIVKAPSAIQAHTKIFVHFVLDTDERKIWIKASSQMAY